MELKDKSLEERKGLLNEVRILASIDHPNIIGYKEAFTESSTGSLCIVMEYASGGDLRQLIDTSIEKETTIDETTIWSYTSQILMGLAFLHESKIAHRDLKVSFTDIRNLKNS